MINPHVKLSISLEEETVGRLMGRGKRSQQISKAVEQLLQELEGRK